MEAGDPLFWGVLLEVCLDHGRRFEQAMLTLLPGGVHEDILRGRDCELAWEDVFQGDEMRSVPGFYEELERKVRMQ